MNTDKPNKMNEDFNITFKDLARRDYNSILNAYKEIESVTNNSRRYSFSINKQAKKLADELKYFSGYVMKDANLMDGVNMKEENKIKTLIGENTMKIRMSQLKEMISEILKEEESKYQDFFRSVLKKYGVKSPAELDDAKKKEFFQYIENTWTKEKTQETLEPVSAAAGNPLKRVKAKKRDQMLAAESKVESYVRKRIREELKFVMFSDIPGAVSRKVAKKRITQSGGKTL